MPSSSRRDKAKAKERERITETDKHARSKKSRRSRSRSYSSGSESDSTSYSSSSSNRSSRRSASGSRSRSNSPSRSRSRSPAPQQRKVLGPSLPPGFNPNNQQSDSDDDDHDGQEYGPTPVVPMASNGGDSDAKDHATRIFLEREERIRKAEQGARLASESASTTRPEWMLAPPKQLSLSSQVGDPLSLKSRGFSQNSRVQSKAGAGVPNVDGDGSLWTETPAQREQRLKDEMLGNRKRATDADGDEMLDQEEVLRRERERERERLIREEIRLKDPSRGKSLLSLHQAKRREEMKDEPRSDKKKSKDRDRHRERDRDEKSSHRSRHSSSNSSKKRSREDEDDSKRSRKSSSRRRDHSDSDSEERRKRRKEKRKRKEEKESEKERKRKEEKKKRLKEEEGKGNAKTMIWDRDSTMSVGGKLMDEKARAKTIRDAAGLSDRFGTGKSSFL